MIFACFICDFYEAFAAWFAASCPVVRFVVSVILVVLGSCLAARLLIWCHSLLRGGAA